MREIILNTIDDMVADFLYYDRKEDNELPVGAIDQAVEDKVISVDEMCAFFKAKLTGGLTK